MVAKIKTIITYLMLNLGVIKEKFHDYWSAKKFQEGNQMTFWKKLLIQITNILTLKVVEKHLAP